MEFVSDEDDEEDDHNFTQKAALRSTQSLPSVTTTRQPAPFNIYNHNRSVNHYSTIITYYSLVSGMLDRWRHQADLIIIIFVA